MLDKLLEKLGISGYDELNKEEKEVYAKMQEALGKQITLDDVKTFLNGEVSRLEFQLLDYNNEPKKDLFLKSRLRNYKMLLAFITGNDKVKENIKSMISQIK